MKLAWGARDPERFRRFPEDERDYAFFMLDLCGGVLEKRPKQIDALRVSADLLTALGYFEAGLSLDRRLARLRPLDAGVWYNLACSLALAGGPDAEPKALLALYVAVAKLGYDAAGHMRADPDLESLRANPLFDELIRLAEVVSNEKSGESCR